jgi:MYXO-CTERM domain-containing protein
MLRLRLHFIAAVAACSFAFAPAARAEDPACLSTNPTDWPAASRPYFMLAVDTSSSMTACTTPATQWPASCDPVAPGYALNACGLEPTRLNDAKCALYSTVLGFAGQVNFGLATYATKLESCPAACSEQCVSGGLACKGVSHCCLSDSYGCSAGCFAKEQETTGQCAGCGPKPGNATTRAGALIRVPMLQDSFWGSPAPSNNAELLSWFDGDCTGNRELFASGATPLNGMLRDMQRYLATGWTSPDGATTFATPLSVNDRAGEGVNGSSGCRSVNVILLTDGDETCDTQADVVAAAASLYQQGVSVGGKTFKVRTYVINFAGGTTSATDQIAAAGGTGKSLSAQNQVQLAQALSSIVSGAVQAETCDNGDNNCNGCTDEGYKHYCDTGLACCAWQDAATRSSCISKYTASIAQNPPLGDTTLLPCTSATQAQNPSTWLCYNAGEVCDDVDNNCQNGVDEGIKKCGSPAHCPKAEVCNGQDDDCDGQIDEGVCGSCVPSPEVCDGCDNDCNGIADDPPPGGFAPVSCGLAAPPNCQGSMTCKAPQSVAQPGACAQGGYGTCSSKPASEVCDGIDNDCNGTIDDGYAPSACKPAANPPGAVYGGTSQCTMGQTQCQNGKEVCTGGTGPSQELCDGVDNDCDGLVDDQAFGVGQACGASSPPCSPGTLQCVAGKLVCSGGVQAQAEVCDGVDNDCDGFTDEQPLADGPAPGKSGCWNEPGNCCSFAGLSWCPPLGADCNGKGSLLAPCAQGSLKCEGKQGWVCAAPKPPAPEACDGVDNDCNGKIDDGTIADVGKACGSNVGACKPGALACKNGVLACLGALGPTLEVCDAIDNDCNGKTDDGIPSGGSCAMPYDAVAFPGDRTKAPCQPGFLSCDGNGQWQCIGGVGPKAEACNGIDDDCDGVMDELGPGPDGIDKSENPFPPPAASLGDSCGKNVGACKPGQFACLNGSFACIGAVAATFESCDCQDNDCDGQTDEPAGPGDPPVCSPGKDCVNAGGTCQCAPPCNGGEYPCPAGQKCVTAKVSGGQKSGGYCVADYDALCGDCKLKTVKDAANTIICAPAGSDGEGCNVVPECQCKGQNGCREPCFGVTCGAGNVCASFGDFAGMCVPDSCYVTECAGCGKVCHDGKCLPNPCSAGSCPGQQCQPSADWTTFTCVPSCAGVACPSGQKCIAGACKPTCEPPCGPGLACDVKAAGGPKCVPSKCTSSCPNGAYCDPLTGACGDPPCAGVVCPAGQECRDGSCWSPTVLASNGGQGGGSLDATPEEKAGCGCETAGAGETSPRMWLLAALGVALTTLRRRPRRPSDPITYSLTHWVTKSQSHSVIGSLTQLLVVAALVGCQAGANTDQGSVGVTGAGGATGANGTGGTGSGITLGTGGGNGCIFTNGGVEICDGADNNCDGQVDEGFDLKSITRCGSCTHSCFAELPNVEPQSIHCEWSGAPKEPGVCSFASCTADYWDLDPQKPGCEYYCVHTGADDAVCNHHDDDCDGKIDEDVNLCSDAQNCGDCGRACSVVHGTGVCQHPDPKAVCDVAHTSCAIAGCADDDQDGKPDWWDLDGIYASGCEYHCSLTNGGVEICGDGIDNDCDGKIDAADDLSGDAQIGVTCYGSPQGLCAAPAHAGKTSCSGTKVVCAGAAVLLPNQVDETCNAVDDDCDGTVDDGPKDAGGFCGKSNIYPCAFGTMQCVTGKLACVGNTDPGSETCNGIDDDCDGMIDSIGGKVPLDAGGACNVPKAPPMGATSPCKAGTLTCGGGVLSCQGWVGPSAASDACGDDSNCDGVLGNQPDLTSDVHHCGSCAVDCLAGAVHANFACSASKCQFKGCQAGYWDLDADQTCEYACTPTGGEICDNVDNDCNGKIDDGLKAPSPTQACGVSIAANRAECTTMVAVSCVQGAWKCAFPAGVCSPTCAKATEICDAVDNDCDGGFNENVANFGLECWSDDGLPYPGHGACRTKGSFVCNGESATTCSAVKAKCSDLAAGCEEKCDGIDNDCDGSVDESFLGKGADTSYFVKPQVTQIGASLFAFSFEASRPSATATSAGAGNGYFCTGQGCPPGMPPAPDGVTLDETIACSLGGRLPWFNVTPVEAEQSCDAIGGRVCTLAEWKVGCGAGVSCTWGYSPVGTACKSTMNAGKFCNSSEYDFSATLLGDQNGLLPGGSPALLACAADWNGAFVNPTPLVYDLTGNLREIVSDASGYRLMGGGFTTSEGGSTCGFDFYSVSSTYQLYDTGFRCCFDVDPRK